jgi:hypothetical protein
MASPPQFRPCIGKCIERRDAMRIHPLQMSEVEGDGRCRPLADPLQLTNPCSH